MPSGKLLNIVLLSIATFILHGVEEGVAGFYLVDRSYLLTVGRLGGDPAMTFMAYQAILWGILFAGYLLIKRGTWRKPLLMALGIVMVLELQHVWETAVTEKYYPGSYTAMAFPVLALLLYLAFHDSRRMQKLLAKKENDSR